MPRSRLPRGSGSTSGGGTRGCGGTAKETVGVAGISVPLLDPQIRIGHRESPPFRIEIESRKGNEAPAMNDHDEQLTLCSDTQQC